MENIREEVEYGRFFKFEVGPISVEKKLYRPTIKRFEKWLNIVEKQPYYTEFDFLLTGSFPSYINNNLAWETWDVDIILIDDGENTLELIRDTLVDISRTALEQCDFYLDTYYQNRKNYIYFDTSLMSTAAPRSLEKDGLAYAQYVKRDGRIVSQWNRDGKEVIEGLWTTKIKVPTPKQLHRLNQGLTYDKELYLSEYEKQYD